MMLTLTFDNGPEPSVTPAVLDALAQRGIHATFFVIGQKLAEGRAVAERAAAEGHWIGNHTWSHTAPLGEGGDADQEIGLAQQAMGELSHPDRLFRPVGGGGRVGPHLLSSRAATVLQEGSFTCVLWTSIPRDWVDPEGWVETALSQCAAADWSVVVLHDLPTGAMRHLPRFLDAAAERGIAFRQNFPSSCTPIVRGAVVSPIESYVGG